MRKGLTTLLVILLAVGALLVSCNANVEAPADELVTISFDNNESSRALSSNLETFTPGAYYWKYAAKKADSSNLISGQTAGYDSNPESGALWIKEGEPGFGETSGQVYTPFKVQGFSQGLWNFRLFGYKKVIGDNPATTEVVETEYYLLAYSGETTGVLLKQNGTNLVKAIVSPTQTGNGTLVVKITGSDKITLDPATPGLIPNTKIKLKVEKITSTAPTPIFEGFVTDDYDEPLEAGTYKVTVKFTNDDASVEFASGSVVSTVYANLTTTVKGNLTEIITSATFGADQNPDIVTTTIGTTAPIVEGAGSETAPISLTRKSEQDTNKVSASLSNGTAQDLIGKLKEKLDADSTTSSMALNLSVDTTEATETTITYEIGMEAVLTYTKNTVSTTTTSTVEEVNDFVTILIDDMQVGLTDVAVTHSQREMTSAQEWAAKSSVTYPLTLDNFLAFAGTESDPDNDGYYYYYEYDSDDADDVVDKAALYIKTKTFSPFQLSYTVPSYVAAIGSTMYESLTAAITAAEAGDTILILKDITTDDGYLVGKTISIDTNGHTITVNEGSNINNRAFKVTGGKLTVFGNGKIVAVGSGTTKSDGAGCYGAFRVESAGQLDVSDMTLINARPWGLNVKVCGGEATLSNVKIDSSYGGGIEVTEKDLGEFSKTGSATLTDCTFTQTGYYDHCSTAVSVSGNSRLVINSGTYTSDNYAIYVFSSGGFVEVNGGTFIGLGTEKGYAFMAQIDTSTYAGYEGGLVFKGGDFSGNFYIEDPATAVITGGSYSVNPSEYVAEGYKAVEGSGVWNVVPITAEDEVYVAGSSYSGARYMTLGQFRDSVNNGTGTDYSGCTIKLQRNIDLTDVAWIPIGTTDHPFNGFFDGQGYTISNLSYNGAPNGQMLGLFGEVKGTQNSAAMTLDGVWNDSSNYIIEESFDRSQYTAGIINLVISGFDITNTSSDGSNRYTGALAGRMDDAYIANITVETSSIKGTKGVGGLVGSFNGSTAKNCRTLSNVSVSATAGGYNVGGLFGGTNYSNNGTKTNYGAIISCVNKASVTIPEDGKTGGYIGGIVGMSQNWVAGNSTISSGYFIVNCTNEGDVEAKTTQVTGIGGIAGFGHNVHAFVGCENTGAINANTVSEGISGISYGGSLIYNSSNSGSITASAAEMAGVFIEYTGQTVGFAFGCSNTGTLTNSNKSGAIAQIAIVGGIITAEGIEFANVNEVSSFISNNNCKNISFIGCTVGNTEGVLDLSEIAASVFADTKLCETVVVRNENVSLNIPSVSVSVPSGSSSSLVLSSMGPNCTVSVASDATISSVTIGGDGSSLSVSGDVTKQISFAGAGNVSATISTGANVNHVGFDGTGSYTLTNEGTISHTQSDDNPSSNEHTVSTIKACNITIHNMGHIEAKKNNAGRCSYALLFYNGCSVVVYEYPSSSITAEVNGYRIACGSAQSVEFVEVK